MDAVIVGIDVAKDKLDVGVRPSGERFVVSRAEAGLEELKDRLAGRADEEKGERIFLIFFRRNPLKSPDPDE